MIRSAIQEERWLLLALTCWLMLLLHPMPSLEKKLRAECYTTTLGPPASLSNAAASSGSSPT